MCKKMQIVSFVALVAAVLHAVPAAAEQSPMVPEGFRSLFNGRDLAGWKGLVKDPPTRAKMSAEELAVVQQDADTRMNAHWHVRDGVLYTDGNGDNLCTNRDFQNFILLVDFKIESEGDSGIYLRGSPQVQIWDPKLYDTGSGGLYNNQKHPSKPLVLADRPIGEWNNLKIEMIGDKVSVWLNDKLVVDKTVMENYWEPELPIYESGPIELQSHTTPLYFRNIYIKELPNLPDAPNE